MRDPTFLNSLGKKNHLLRWIKKGTMFDFNIYIHASTLLPPPYCPCFCDSPSHQPTIQTNVFFLIFFEFQAFFLNAFLLL